MVGHGRRRRHEASINLARSHDRTAGIDYLVGDFLTYPFEPELFDVIVSVAALHHMDAGVALARIVGLARNRRPGDLLWDVAGLVADRVYKRRRSYWDHSAPIVWPPSLTYGQTRRVAEAELPGVRYRRHLLFRYSLRWTRPVISPGRRR